MSEDIFHYTSSEPLDSLMEAFNAMVAREKFMLEKKRKDYSKSGSMDNFIDSARIAGVSPVTSCMVLAGVKVDRLSNLITKGDKPNYESIEDTISDLRNYLFLLSELLDKPV